VYLDQEMVDKRGLGGAKPIEVANNTDVRKLLRARLLL
jgi:hypothetical protein